MVITTFIPLFQGELGRSIYIVFLALRHLTKKGPVDAITADARYALSEDKLLREKIEPANIVSTKLYHPFAVKISPENKVILRRITFASKIYNFGISTYLQFKLKNMLIFIQEIYIAVLHYHPSS